MSLESSFSCKYTPKIREKTIVERLDEFTTFRDISVKKLQEKRKEELERIQKETKLACFKERAEFAKNDFTKVNLDELGKVHETITRTSMVRKQLFGTNEDIIKSKGVLANRDQQMLESCDKNNAKTLICNDLRGKKREKIELSGTFPVNFRRNLDEVWQVKIQDRSNNDTYTEIRAFYEHHVKPFTSGEKDFTKITRKKYEKEVRDSIQEVRQASNLNKGFASYGISTHTGLELAKALANKISEADLIALGVTELMDRNSPEFNSAVLTTILEKAGKEYLLFAPALGDNLLSYGPYQITKSAVNGKNGGATMADDRFTGGKILKVRDITEFPLDDHHKAAYLLALTNVALLVKAIPSEYIVISGKGKDKKKIIYDLQKLCLDLIKHGDKDFLNLFIGFIAGAHNRQDVAKKGVVNWLIARCTTNATLVPGGHLSDNISHTSPQTVPNNSDKQTGKGKEGGGNRGIIVSLLESR